MAYVKTISKIPDAREQRQASVSAGQNRIFIFMFSSISVFSLCDTYVYVYVYTHICFCIYQYAKYIITWYIQIHETTSYLPRNLTYLPYATLRWTVSVVTYHTSTFTKAGMSKAINKIICSRRTDHRHPTPMYESSSTASLVTKNASDATCAAVCADSDRASPDKGVWKRYGVRHVLVRK